MTPADQVGEESRNKRLEATARLMTTQQHLRPANNIQDAL